MVKLVLDTNQIVEKDWRLRSASMRLVEKAAELGIVSIVVPEIVVEETKNKFRQRLKSYISSAEDRKAKISNLVDSEIELALPNVDDACKEYDDYLDARLKELNATRPDYSKVDHKWLTEKALGARRPFREGDRGYRDALVWHSVLKDVASADEHTFFVSDNKRDFGDEKGSLHSDLIADLNEVGFQDQVTYLHDIHKVVETVIKPALEQIPSPLTVDDFEALFDVHLDSIIGKTSVDIERQGLPGIPNELFEAGPYIEGLELVSAGLVDAYALDDASMYTEFDVLVEANFDQTVYRPDAIWIAEQFDMSVTGGDDKLTDLSFALSIPLTVAVVTSTEEGVEPEISVELKEFYGYCPHCGHPELSDAAEQCSSCGRALF